MGQKRIFNGFHGQIRSNKWGMTNPEEYRIIWSAIWSIEKEHNKKGDLLNDLKKEVLKLVKEKAKKQCRKMPN